MLPERFAFSRSSFIEGKHDVLIEVYVSPLSIVRWNDPSLQGFPSEAQNFFINGSSTTP
jgi:hypothetical protein